MLIEDAFESLAAKIDEKPSVLEGRGITLERGAGGVALSANAESQTAPIAAAASQFPFKTAISSDGAGVAVLGYNADKKRYFRNYVTLGMTRLEVAETSFSSISADAWIYLSISYGTEYKAELKSAASLPEQSSSAYIVPIAFVRAENGKPAGVVQAQYGPVEGSGRIF